MSLWFVSLGSAGPWKLCSLWGPGSAPLLATADKVQVEKLEYEAPTEVEQWKK